MDARKALTRGLAGGLRLGRGAADRAATVVGPALARLLRMDRPTTTKTFTPTETPAAAKSAGVPGYPGTPAPAEPASQSPSPASVARNIAPERPTVKPAPAKRKPAPGAKLPPRRATTS